MENLSRRGGGNDSKLEAEKPTLLQEREKEGQLFSIGGEKRPTCLSVLIPEEESFSNLRRGTKEHFERTGEKLRILGRKEDGKDLWS